VTAGAGTAVLSGVDALVRLLLVRQQLDELDGLATATMVSGYPGSPLGTFDLTLDAAGADVLARHRIVHRPGLNEELAAAIVWGSQMGAVVPYSGVDGVVGAWYGKGPGLDRSGDALRHANAMGAGPNGGAVMFCGDDPGAKSSTLTCDSQYTFADACVPVLYPGDQQDVLDLGVHAFGMSRYSGAWVGLKVVTSVADGIGTVDLSLGRHALTAAELVVDGLPWRHQPLATVGPHAVPDQEILVADRRLRAAAAYARANGVDRVTGAGPGARLGIVCAGKTYFDVMDALASLGAAGPAAAGIRVLRLGMTFPLAGPTVLEFAASVSEIVVIEEKRPFIEGQLRAILHEAAVPVPVAGKRDRSGQALTSLAGELDADAIAAALTRVAPGLGAPPARSPGGTDDAPRGRTEYSPGRSLPVLALRPAGPPSRSPGYCSGCPHNRSTVLPDGALAGGGVGCHGIMYFEARHAGGKRLPPPPMGAEGVPWLGLAPFVAEPHLIQNLGDGTLSHSGTLAIRAAVAAGADMTFKILYNATVAMTGGQDVTGLMEVPALTRALAAEGASQIVVCAEDPRRYGRRTLAGRGPQWAKGVRVLGRDQLPRVQESLRRARGVTVIIYDQRCAAQARRLRNRGELARPPRRVVINEAVCEGCGDCGVKSNCLSVLPVATEFGDKRRVHDPSCNRDYSCLDGDCPSFVTITPRRPGWRRARRPPGVADNSKRRLASLPSGVLPAPQPPAASRRHGVYFTGIGGTGVVTANRIVAAMGEAAGLAIGGLDQTGLSQKAGAVASHLHLAGTPAELGAAAVGTGGASLYLSGDILQAASPRHLAKIRPGETVVVVDPELTPTAAMLQSSSGGATPRTPRASSGGATPRTPRDMPDIDALRAAITERARGAGGVPGQVAFVAAKRIAEAVFSDHLLANVILLGAAFQLGGIPVSLQHAEIAMKRQGKAAAVNREAFEWGRWAVHDPAAVEAALLAAGQRRAPGPYEPSPAALAAARPLTAGAGLPASLPPDLRDLLTRRAAQAADYQDARLAARFLRLVARAAVLDDKAREDTGDHSGHGWALTRAVAESWFKLLTYKDEYEVARLHLAADYDAAARELGIDGPYSVTYHLHPPALRRLGLRKKLPLGAPYAVAFRVLRPMRRLRGTALDVFGWDRDRRAERALITEFEKLIEDAVAAGDDAGMPRADLVRLAGSVMSIKGYGPVKEAAIARWRADAARLREAVPA
jgi:indolepyruvate ferredoxin oxidoreductase